MHDRLFYTRAEAADLLRISLRTADTLLANGRLSSIRIGGRRLIPRDVILNMADSAARERLGV